MAAPLFELIERHMGRPKTFRPDEILEKAMLLFWQQGYEATTVEDLVRALGLNRSSIYNSFGDKHAVFIAAVEYYCTYVAGQLRTVLENDEKGLDAIKDYYTTMAGELSLQGGRKGCFLQNSTLERVLCDPEIETLAQSTNNSFVREIEIALTRARNLDEIPDTVDTGQTARFLFAIGQGMIVVAKGHGDPEFIQAICDGACKAVDELQQA